MNTSSKFFENRKKMLQSAVSAVNLNSIPVTGPIQNSNPFCKSMETLVNQNSIQELGNKIESPLNEISSSEFIEMTTDVFPHSSISTNVNFPLASFIKPYGSSVNLAEHPCPSITKTHRTKIQRGRLALREVPRICEPLF